MPFDSQPQPSGMASTSTPRAATSSASSTVAMTRKRRSMDAVRQPSASAAAPDR